MPKIFSNTEREKVERDLMIAARALFAKKGFLKTSIGELTKSVGIAAGTFYNFFGSKEALFFEIMGESEKLRFKKIGQLFTQNGDAKQEFTSFLKETFTLFINDPVYHCLYAEDLFERIIKKIPQEKLILHMQYDIDAAKAILSSTQPRGFLCQLSSDELVSQLRALFLQTLHQDQIGVLDMNAFMMKQIDIYVAGVSTLYGRMYDTGN